MLLLAAAGRACVSIPAPQRPTPGSAPHHCLRLRLPPIVCHYRGRRTKKEFWKDPTPPQRPEPLARPIPARDRVIRFGRFNGKMMGTLPPSYLRWMVEEFELGEDTAPWARLAREVLDDPVYVDRDEWERHRFAVDNWDGEGPFPDMPELFGWDRSDVEGWRRVNYDLIGTSFSGRIPRKGAAKQSSSGSDRAGGVRKKNSLFDGGPNPAGSRGKRGERRERMRMRRDDQARAAKLEMLGVKADVADDGVPEAPRKARATTTKEQVLGLPRGNDQVSTAKLETLGVSAGMADDGVPGTPRKARATTAKEAILGFNLAGEVLQVKREAGKGGNPFPGRQALLDKVRKLKS